MKRPSPIRLKSGRTIGQGHPCFLVAEIGNNHQGDYEVARRMVRVAADVGAHAVKFQKRNMPAMFTKAGMERPYPGRNSFGATYGEHRLALELDMDQMRDLKELAEDLGLCFFASVWDAVSLKEMRRLDVELLKIGSADMVNLPLLRQAGETRIPIILSTGMSALEEVDTAVAELRRYHDDIILLHCNSSYPCPEEQIGLPVIEELRCRYGLPVGYSGHEQGLGPSVAAAVFSPCVIERHFTLDKDMRGTDHQASLDPEQFRLLAAMVREVEAAMRVGTKQVFSGEKNAAEKLRKSVVFARDLPAGHVLAEEDLTVKCPGNGVSPLRMDEFVGRALLTKARHDEQLLPHMVAPGDAKAESERLLLAQHS